MVCSTRGSRLSSRCTLISPCCYQASVSWVGERINVFPEFPYADTVNPAYATLDLRASWELRKGIAPYARVTNALDREYEAVLGFPASGRTVIGGVRLEW